MAAPKKVGRPSVKEEWSIRDMAAFLESALHRQALEPNLLAYKPHPKQEAFHKSTAFGRWFLGGNRSGKSVAGVVEDLWWATKRHPYHRIDSHLQIRGRVVGVDFTNGCEGILFPIFKRWLVPSDLVNGSWEDSYNRMERTLFFADGSFVEFKSSDQDLDKHAGTSRHFIHFDEEPPKLIFDENLLRIVDTGGKWWLTMTPVNGMTWVYDQLWERVAHEDFEPADPFPVGYLDIFEVEMDENPHLSLDAKERALMFLDADTRKKREKGLFIPRGGRVFKEYFESTHFQKEVGWRPPKSWKIYTSTDYGMRNPTAHLYHAVHPDGFPIVTFHEFYGSDTTIKEWAKLMLDFEREEGLEIYMRTGDPNMKQRMGTGSSVLAEYWEEGIQIGVESVPKDPSIGIERMTQYFSIDPKTNVPYWTITQECPAFNKELKRLEWESYASPKLEDRNNPQEKVHKKNDHAFDSAKYFATFMPDLRALVTETRERDIDTPWVQTLADMSATVSSPDNTIGRYQRTRWETQSGAAFEKLIGGTYVGNGLIEEDDY